MNWLQRIAEIAGREGPVARVVIIGTDGPTPRSVGAAMLVWLTGSEGKIGRGETEAAALVAARELIAQASGPQDRGGPRWLRRRLRLQTGDVLGAASGGSIDLLIEVIGPAELASLDLASVVEGRVLAMARDPVSGSVPMLLTNVARMAPEVWRNAVQRLSQMPQLALVRTEAGDGAAVVERLSPSLPRFHVYGSGLVARALVKLVADLPFEVVWIDTAPGHFPSPIAERVRTVVSEDPAALAGVAAAGGLHAVMTTDHACDLAIVRALARSGGATYLGVIGSRLKRKRLIGRLAAEGIDGAVLERISCPIGLPGIRSKNPAVIAVAIAAQALLAVQSAAEGSHAQPDGEPGRNR